MFLLCTLLGLWPGRARGQAALLLQRPLSGGVLLPPTSVALIDSAFSLSLNPAGLPLSSTSFAYLHEEGDPDRPVTRRSDAGFVRLGGMNEGDQWGLAFGASAEWIRPPGGGCPVSDPCYRRISLGLGIGTETISAGLAYHFYSSWQSHGINHLGTLDLGLLWRPASWLSFGAVAQGFNGQNNDDLSVPALYKVGVALRPVGGWVTLGVDYSADNVHGWGGSYLEYLARLSIPQGLAITAELAQPVAGFSAANPGILQLGLQGSFEYLTIDFSAAGFSAGSPVVGSGNVAVEGSLAQRPSIVGVVKTAQALDLTAALKEPDGILELLGLTGGGITPYAAVSLRLHQLAEDPTLEVLVLKLHGLDGVSLGRVEGLRARVAEIRAHGKKVLFWLESGGDTDYYLATSGDRIYALPQASLEINGLASTHIYLRGLLDKIGVQPEFVKIGEYKSAPEQFTNTSASEASAEETNALLDDEYSRYVNAVSAARGLSPDKVREILNRGVFTSDMALDAGLVDGLSGSGPALDKPIESLAGHPLMLEHTGPTDRVPTRWGVPPRIGLVEIAGDIVGGDQGATHRVAAAEHVVRELRIAAEDPSIRAVVLRVESPGGDVAASELIWQAVKELRERKPVVASFGDVAASGGYYVACGANLIVAEPSTLTGSIGVFAGKADLSKLLGFLGVSTQVFKRGDRADFYSLVRSWTADERQVAQNMVQRMYDVFLDRVAAGRGLKREQVDAVARGRVWTGAQAKDRGLVDVLGDLDVALARARQLGGLPAAAQVEVIGSSGLFKWPDVSKLNGALGRAAGAMAMGPMTLMSPAEALRDVMTLGAQASPEALEAAEPLVRALTEGKPLALAVDLPLAR